jgi:hypothetical protein
MMDAEKRQGVSIHRYVHVGQSCRIALLMDGSLSDTPDCDARYDLVNAHSLSFLGVHHVRASQSGVSDNEPSIKSAIRHD